MNRFIKQLGFCLIVTFMVHGMQDLKNINFIEPVDYAIAIPNSTYLAVAVKNQAYVFTTVYYGIVKTLNDGQSYHVLDHNRTMYRISWSAQRGLDVIEENKQRVE